MLITQGKSTPVGEKIPPYPETLAACFSQYFGISNVLITLLIVYKKWSGGEQTRIKLATHVDLKAVEEFLRNKTYPKGILKDKGKKSNFRKPCKNFSIVNGDLMYKEKWRVVFEVVLEVVLLLTNSFRRKFGIFKLPQTWFGVKRWLLWPIIETLYEKGSRYFPRQYLFTK